MKNIQVIERAENCGFFIHSVSEEDFNLIFPEQGQELEFVEDLFSRIGERQAGLIVQRVTRRRLLKRDVHGIDGTLYINLIQRKKWFPNKREDDADLASQTMRGKT